MKHPIPLGGHTKPASLQHLIDHIPPRYRDPNNNSQISLLWKGLNEISLSNFFRSSSSGIPVVDNTTLRVIEIICLLFSATINSQSKMPRVNELRWIVSEGLIQWCLNVLKYFIIEEEWNAIREKLKNNFRNITFEELENGIWDRVRLGSNRNNNKSKDDASLPDFLKSLNHFSEKREETFSCICTLKHLRYKRYVENIYGLLGILERLATIDEGYAFEMIKSDVVDIILPYLEGCLTFIEMKAATGVLCALAQNTVIRKFVFRLEVIRRMYYFLEEIPSIIEYEFMLKPLTRLLYHKRILNSTMQDYNISSKNFKEYHLESVTATSILVSWRGDVVVYFNIFLNSKRNRAAAYISRYCPLFIEKAFDTINLLPTSRTISTVTECLVTISIHQLGRKYLINSPHAIEIITYGARCSGFCQQHCMMALHNLLVYAEENEVLQILNSFSNLWPLVIEYEESGKIGLKVMTFIIEYLDRDPNRLLQFSNNNGVQYTYNFYKRIKQEKTMPKAERMKLMEEAEKTHELGNERYLKGFIEEATALYEKALELCPLMFPIPRIKSLGNIASCKFKLGQFDEVITYCTRALNLCEPINSNQKYIHRRQQAFEKLEKIGFASQDYHYFLFLKYGELESDMDEDIERCTSIDPKEREKRATLLNRTVKNFVFNCMKSENEDIEIHRFTDQDFLDIEAFSD